MYSFMYFYPGNISRFEFPSVLNVSLGKEVNGIRLKVLGGKQITSLGTK